MSKQILYTSDFHINTVPHILRRCWLRADFRLAGATWILKFPEEPSAANYVLFDNMFGTGDAESLEEISITQWVYIHKLDGAR